MAEVEKVELGRNPYTGMDMAADNSGNGEKVDVADLINAEQPEWSEFKPEDTITESKDSHLDKVFSSLENPTLDEYSSDMPKKVSVENIMNMDQKTWKTKESETEVLGNDPVAQLNNKTQGYEYGMKVTQEFKHDDLSLRDDELINNLTSVLNL